MRELRFHMKTVIICGGLGMWLGFVKKRDALVTSDPRTPEKRCAPSSRRRIAVGRLTGLWAILSPITDEFGEEQPIDGIIDQSGAPGRWGGYSHTEESKNVGWFSPKLWCGASPPD